MILETQHKWYKPNPMDIGWQGEPCLARISVPVIADDLSTSRLLEPHRISGIPPLWGVRVLLTIRIGVSIGPVDLLGKLGFPDREWLSDMGGHLS